MVTGNTPTLEELRIRASRLLKDLNSADPAVAERAAARLGLKPGWTPDAVRRKHALQAVAREAGFAGWTALRQEVDPAFDPAYLFDEASGAYLNRWFRTYEEARESLDQDGGYLFPYRSQFVVCDQGFLEGWGINAADPDWDRIGRDWARPRDVEARGRLARSIRPKRP